MFKHTPLAVGELQHPELQGVRDWLVQHQAESFKTCGELLWHLHRAPSPRWIFLCAARRAQFTAEDVERVHLAAPFARLVHVCGSLCEGETRSGNALGGVPRVMWHAFAYRTGAVDNTGDHAGWLLPRTATPIDVLLQTNVEQLTFDGVRVGIVADRREDFLALADGVQSIGATACWLRKNATANDVDLVLSNTRRLVSLVEVEQPVIALLDFPRLHEFTSALNHGASVLAKPFLWGDLRVAFAAALGHCMASPARHAG